MLLLLEKHISAVFYVGFVYVCIPQQGPEAMFMMGLLWF